MALFAATCSGALRTGGVHHDVIEGEVGVKDLLNLKDDEQPNNKRAFPLTAVTLVEVMVRKQKILYGLVRRPTCEC